MLPWRGRNLHGDVVVITGASSGIGRASALAFADHGCRLVVAARGEPALREVALACERRGAPTLVVPVDVADADAVASLGARAVERFGHIDVWVEAAAMVVAAPFGEETVEEARRLLATNVEGTLWGSRTALQTFTAQGSGVLVNVGSLLGLVPNPLVPDYVMSKFAVRGLSLALRQAVAGRRGVHLCLVLPGPVDTPLFQRAANRTGRRLRAIPPAYAPERVAAVIVGCARRPRRQATVGAVSRAVLVAHRIAPRATEWLVARVTLRTIVRREAAPPTSGTLFEPWPDGGVHGGWRRGRVRRRLGERLGSALARRGARPPGRVEEKLGSQR
jgi:short-subunit dehydrogenase